MNKELNEKEAEKYKKKIKKQINILGIAVISMVIVSIASIILLTIAIWEGSVAKPIIYIYPEKEQKVEVSVGKPEKLTTTYPKYIDKWSVIAKPDGTLIDTKTNRKLYALYWEGKDAKTSNMKKGFVVKGQDTVQFLEEKLEILGLNEKEAEEFIIYWLPKMEHNEYNYIYFQTNEEINNYMALNITPKPDTLIRIMMEFKALDKPIEIEKQQLTKVERSGYTVVEWGGTEIK